MTNVTCPYIESRLMNCLFDLNHNSCGHDEDAGVRCSSSTTGKSHIINRHWPAAQVALREAPLYA